MLALHLLLSGVIPSVNLNGEIHVLKTLGLLRRMPSALKRESDRLRGDKNDQVKLKQTCYILFISRPILQVTLSADGMVLRLYLEKVKRWMSEGRKAEAAALMQEMFKRLPSLI